MEYNVKIAASGLTSSGTSNGFIDAKSSFDYHKEIINTSEKNLGTMVANTMFRLNDTPVVLTGTNSATLISSINSRSRYHHFVASVADNKLSLTPLPNYTHLVGTISDITPGITDVLGFVKPIDSNDHEYPNTNDDIIEKTRGYWRWIYVMETLQKTSNIGIDFIINPTGADSETAATEINFILDIPESYHYNYNNQLVFGEEAVRRAIADALMRKGNETLDIIYDPTSITSPTDPTVTFPQTLVVEKIEIGALTTNATTAYNAVTVTVKT